MSDAVLIVGGGVAGLTAALACAEAGARVVVVERGAVVGGRHAADMTSRAAAAERVYGAPVPTLHALAAHENLELLTLAELEAVEGRPGSFQVSVRQQARFVTDDCTRCNHCHAVCPVVVPNAYDAGLTFRKAIHTPLVETLPGAYAIDIESCLNRPPNYLPCHRCVEVCDDHAIRFDVPLSRVHERYVGAVILAPGFEVTEGRRLADLGYGVHPDVVTWAELQRLLEAPGPTGGFVARPSNEESPGSVLLVLDDVSAFAAEVAASQVRRLSEQDVGRIAVLVLAPPGAGGAPGALGAATAEAGAALIWGASFQVEPGEGDLPTVRYAELPSGRLARQEFDLVVLCAAVRPPAGLAELAHTAGVALAESGYLAVSPQAELAGATSRPGVFAAGCASGPKNVAATVADAGAAAGAALELLDPRLLGRQAAAGAGPREPGAAPRPELRAEIERMLRALIKLGGG